MSNDALYMQRCLELASQAGGKVLSNPMVGAVLVYRGRIIGEGYHTAFGKAHAEVEAFASVQPEDEQYVSASTFYVNLEPCNHQGKTPPCCDLILQKKVSRVVIANVDPNPLVSGSGIQRLRANGVELITGILEKEGRALNRKFFTFHEKKRPYITLKWAESADGFIAGEHYTPVHFTNNTSDLLVHSIRSEHMAIFAGGRTVLQDNPQLTNRLYPGPTPMRMTLDTHGDLPRSLHIFQGEAPTVVFHFDSDAEHGNVRFVHVDPADPFSEILDYCYRHSISSILIEGGANTLFYFIHRSLYDALYIFISEKEIHAGIQAPKHPDLPFTTERLFTDTLLSYHV